MTVDEIVAELGLRVFSAGDLKRRVTGGYASDMLSCVMARARSGDLWVTLQAHPNVVAVASLLDLAGVIVTEGVQPEHEVVARAEENGVTMLGSTQTTFGVVSCLCRLGVVSE